ncbi:MAG: J domain-containing protein [Terracidiphilus sp.]|nr:J domain-containing protein [Terracidiphilus sp.]
MRDETYYSLLEVPETASLAELRAAYRRLMLDAHPDRLANAPAYWQRRAEERAKAINEAFGVLSNPDKRRSYDAQLRAYAESQNGDRARSSEQSASNGKKQTQYSGGSQSGPRTGSGTTPQSQPNQTRTSSQSSSYAQRDAQPKSISPGLNPAQKLFFALVIGLFGFGAAGNFWNAASIGEGLFSFLLAASFLFGLACLFRGGLSRFLFVLRIKTLKLQIGTTVGAIAILLFAGKALNILRTDTTPITRQSSTPVPSTSSNTPPDASGTGSAFKNTQLMVPVSLPNGTEMLRRRRVGGYGKFTVDNGTQEDAVVELVDVGTKKAIRAFYVQSQSLFTEDRVGAGTYNIYFLTGLGWNSTMKQFSINPQFGVFDEVASFSEQRDEATGTIGYHNIRVTLQPVQGGNARTSGLASDEFKNAMSEGDSQ